MFRNQIIKLFIVATATCIVLSLGACSPKISNIGYVHDTPIKDQITIGKSTHEEVLAKLGSPSSQSSFGDETWYYVTGRKETMAFLRPEIVQEDITGIIFDGNGVVSKIEDYNINDSKDFELVKRTTPTEGHTLGFFEQVLGNVGRFNGPGGGRQGSVAPGGRRPN
jgi:outer membrane protein assembly factor BamE (lipoprotein component of BamABCDE complex)